MKRVKVICLVLILTVFSIASLACAGLNDGLVAYYQLNGNAVDASGNGNDGTVVGSPDFQPSPFGTAPKFTSRSTYIVSDNSGLSVDGWTALTISAWVKMDAYTTYGTVVERGSDYYANGNTSHDSYILKVGGDVGYYIRGYFQINFCTTCNALPCFS